ncbi:Toprim domain-containing protein [Mucilaginibacter yixingensis]|uniref:Toprim domain-containing protein n=1 Tax=Mucilaginibacter yixingensis TaxID=1295612 RepID=A0A2T5J4L1_9SPHI|nr:toprim domain-containing protein [Mucilaginibacter yixingensis]PTQ92144.1 Toprim domain-containing protein [Mucilaginibacter yixingensis]
MLKSLNASELKQQVSLVELLSRLGYEPVPRRGREAMYISMLRDDDTRPSLSVNDELGVWYDHGTGKGGNVIDFGLAYWKPAGFQEVVEKLNEVYQRTPLPAKAQTRPRNAIKEPHYKVEVVNPLGTRLPITEYLKSRGVFHVAGPYLRELNYYIENKKGNRRYFFAAGWLNECGGWEVRNRFFKGCIGTKAISFVDGNPRKVAVFEGFLDFLSWKVEKPDDDRSVIVLNSLSLLKAGVGKAKSFPDIDLYFDRDPPGLLHTREFIGELPYATDRSNVYDGYKDFNDKLQASLKASPMEAKPADLFANVKVPFRR